MFLLIMLALVCGGLVVGVERVGADWAGLVVTGVGWVIKPMN